MFLQLHYLLRVGQLTMGLENLAKRYLHRVEKKLHYISSHFIDFFKYLYQINKYEKTL